MFNVQWHKMYAASPDRIAALLLWKFRLLGDAEMNIMRKVVREGTVALDIGANIGFHTLELARLVGPRGIVFAFEPAPENYALLVKNIASNNYRNVVAVQKAVSSRTHTVKLFLSEEHAGDHRIFDSRDGRQSVEVEAVSLDDFFAGDERVDFIKMDIQGAEYLALLGMERLLRRSTDLILMCEFAPSLLAGCGASAELVIDKLRECGFRLQFVNEDAEKVEPVSPEALMRLCGHHGYVTLYLQK